jgi:signal transduction histidine kinase
MASPGVELLLVDLAAGEERALDAGALPAPGHALLVLYEPPNAGQAERLARSRPVHLLCKEGDYLAQLPLAAQAALWAGRLVRDRLDAHKADAGAMAEARRRLEAAIECMSEGLLVIDREYRFATINPVARELLGVESLEELAAKLRDGEIDTDLHPIFWLEAHGEEAKPVRCWDLRQCGQEECPAYGSGLFPCWLYDGTACDGEPGERFPGKLEACYRCAVYRHNARVRDPAQARGRREVTLSRPRKKILTSVSAPIVDDQAQFLGVVKLLRDVTTERLLEQVRAEFISFVTHELRTPLTSLSGFLSLVLGGHAGELTDAQRRHLKAARRQGERLGRLVNNLLDVSAIEAGRLELQLSHFDMVTAIAEAIEMLRPQARRKRLDLRVMPTDEPLFVVADRERIIQVLTNLVGNAIKYTSAGGRATVTASATDEGALVEVADTGRGIGPEDLPRIFDKFSRVRSPGARAVEGSGLGLAISKGIVEAHGGRIWAESAAGEGSRFFLTIPPQERPSAS